MNNLTCCILVFLSALIISSHSHAQVRLSLFAGGQSTNVKYSIHEVKQPTESKFGFHGGLGMKVNFEGHLYFFPSMSYYQFGYDVSYNKKSNPPDSLATANSVRMHQLHIDPVLQFDIGKTPSHFFLRAGPSFQFVISGKEKYTKSAGELVDQKMNLGIYEDYGRILVSLVPAIGYETASGFYVDFQYTLGLTSMCNVDNGPQILQRMAGVTLGYYFKNKKIVIDTKNKE
jgi:outer membrane protein with beta-barrel domain